MDAQLSSERSHAEVIKNLTKEEMRKVHTLLMKKMYHDDPEYNKKYKQYQTAYREKKSQDEEYRKKHVKQVCEYQKQKYAADPAYREYKLQKARERYHRKKEENAQVVC
jgi:hypothetical protein